MANFTFNGKHNLIDLDCIIVGPISLPAVNEIVENIEIEGRKSGSLTVKTGSFKDSKVTVKLQLNNIDAYDEQYADKKAAVEEWISEVTDKRLIFDDNTDKSYIVKKAVITEFEDYKRFYSRFEITFTCEPFLRYANEKELIINKEDVIINPGSVESEPTIQLKLPSTEQNVQITINDKTFQINNVKDSVYINSGLYVCRNESGNVKSVGEFPILSKGENKISWSGTINEFKIIRNVLFRG